MPGPLANARECNTGRVDAIGIMYLDIVIDGKKNYDAFVVFACLNGRFFWKIKILSKNEL